MTENLRPTSEVESNSKQRVVIIMGSPSDGVHGQKIIDVLERLEVKYDKLFYSAHKTQKELEMVLDGYKVINKDEDMVIITVAGLSDTLSGMVKGYMRKENPPIQVIACPPHSEKYSGNNIWSVLLVPYGTDLSVILDPGNAALVAAGQLARNNPELADNYLAEMERLKEKVLSAND